MGRKRTLPCSLIRRLPGQLLGCSQLRDHSRGGFLQLPCWIRLAVLIHSSGNSVANSLLRAVPDVFTVWSEDGLATDICAIRGEVWLASDICPIGCQMWPSTDIFAVRGQVRLSTDIGAIRRQVGRTSYVSSVWSEPSASHINMSSW